MLSNGNSRGVSAGHAREVRSWPKCWKRVVNVSAAPCALDRVHRAALEPFGETIVYGLHLFLWKNCIFHAFADTKL